MKVTTKENAVSTPAKFEVGKRYRTFPHKFGMVTVLKRNKTTIDFCLSGNESKVIRRKFFADSVYAHDAESVSYGQHDNHFWFVAKDVVDELEQAAETVAEVTEDNNVGNLTDSALAASNSRLAAFRTNDTTAEIDVSEYAITEEAFNFAVEQEIEDAEQAAFEARVTARILADDNLAALYEKAKSQVKCERYESWRSWYFKGKNRDEWELNATKAAACLTRYGLDICEFVILHDAEVAVIESNGYDETAFDFLPNFEDDELRDYLYDFDERQQLLEDKYEPKTAADTVTEENKIYTLTVYATEDFKGLYGGNTLVKNFDTCWKLYDSGKHVIFANSWKLERAGKTIATGDGVKDFCRFITCEFDVSERLAEIVDARSVDMEICGEHVYFQNGKFMWVRN